LNTNMPSRPGGRHWLRRRGALVLAALAGAIAVAVPVAWASDLFGDVPDSNPFHDDIGALYRAGITNGCQPSPLLFCPNDNITRQAEAAFVHRAAGRAGIGSTPNDVLIGDDLVDLGAVTLTIGGATGRTQFVKLDAAVTTYISDPTGCPCETAYVISDSLGNPVSNTHYLVNRGALTPSGFEDASGAATAVVPVETGTTQSFHVLAVRSDPTPSSGSVFGYAEMSAITAPFGSTGSNTLGTTSRGGPRATGGGIKWILGK
jgi:hypothetical protein